MDPVKTERVSPQLTEGAGNPEPITRPPTNSQPVGAPLKPSYHPGHASNPGSVSLVQSDDGSLAAVLLPGGPPNTNFSGKISDAVSKILDDYDWSTIPLANKDGDGSERRKVHVKRPMNAFMVWAQEARRKLSNSHRQVHNAELSKSLGRIWRGMSDEQKRPFIERADHLRRKHKQEYPDYKYQPRRRKENLKTVGGKQPHHQTPQGHLPQPTSTGLSVHDLATSHHFVSGCVKGEGVGLGLHPLSPPHSPAGQVDAGPSRVGHGGEGVPVTDPFYVPDCLTDTLESIDRAEMNKYLLPDQAPIGCYPGPHHHNLQPITTITSMPPINTMTTGGTPPTAPHTSGSTSTLTTLPSLTRLLPPASVYGGSSSPYYSGGASPQPPSHGSPELSGDLANGVGSSGGVSPGGSPGSPAGEYVELQPSRVPKEEPLPSLTPLKPPGVSPFPYQNLCYPSQSYAFQYSYPYAMWH